MAVSGGGRSLENLLAVQSNLDFEVAGVIASRPDCRGAEIALQQPLPLFVGNFSESHAFENSKEIYRWLNHWRVEWVVLAGFLKNFPVDRKWKKRIINIHPALLPKYGGHGMYGHRVHEAVAKNKDLETGATVHYVNERYDEGDVIAQKKVAIKPGDSPEAIAAKVFELEKILLPETIQKLVTAGLS